MPKRGDVTTISVCKEMRDWLKHYKDGWGCKSWDEFLYNIAQQLPKED